MYFEKFPTTFYTLDDQKTVQIVRNIFLRLNINENIKNNLSLYDEYDVLDGETPEIVADKFYKNSQYHWLILHMNDILDPRFDCQSKYTNIYATHHYEDADGYRVNSTQPGSTPISNFTYEEDLNESKRRIRMLKPQYLEAVSREFTNKLEGING